MFKSKCLKLFYGQLCVQCTSCLMGLQVKIQGAHVVFVKATQVGKCRIESCELDPKLSELAMGRGELVLVCVAKH